MTRTTFSLVLMLCLHQVVRSQVQIMDHVFSPTLGDESSVDYDLDAAMTADVWSLSSSCNWEDDSSGISVSKAYQEFQMLYGLPVTVPISTDAFKSVNFSRPHIGTENIDLSSFKPDGSGGPCDVFVDKLTTAQTTKCVDLEKYPSGITCIRLWKAQPQN